MREVELGGGNTTDLGRGNTTDLGRGNTTDFGRGNTTDFGRGNTTDFGRQVSTGESRPLKKSDGSPESKTSPSYGPSVREPQKTLEINRLAVLQTVIKPPLTIKQGSASDKFQIVPGVVNGEMPTLGGITLDATTTPESTITESVYYWIKVVGTFATPLDTYVVTIEAVTTDGVPSGTDITATGFVSFYYIGEVDVDTSTDPDSYTITNQHSGGNLGVDSWGLYNIWWRS